MEIIMLLSGALILVAAAMARKEYKLYKDFIKNGRYRSVNERTDLNRTKHER